MHRRLYPEFGDVCFPTGGRPREPVAARGAPAAWRGALAAVLLGLGGVAAPAAEPPPATRVDNPVGLRWRETMQECRMPEGRGSARFVFAVENMAREPVALLAIQASCPCVSFVLPPLPGSPLVLRPGGKATLQVDLEARPALRVQEETLVVESTLGFSVLRVKAVRAEKGRDGGASKTHPRAADSGPKQ